MMGLSFSARALVLGNEAMKSFAGKRAGPRQRPLSGKRAQADKASEPAPDLATLGWPSAESVLERGFDDGVGLDVVVHDAERDFLQVLRVARRELGGSIDVAVRDARGEVVVD